MIDFDGIDGFDDQVDGPGKQPAGRGQPDRGL